MKSSSGHTVILDIYGSDCSCLSRERRQPDGFKKQAIKSELLPCFHYNRSNDSCSAHGLGMTDRLQFDAFLERQALLWAHYSSERIKSIVYDLFGRNYGRY